MSQIINKNLNSDKLDLIYAFFKNAYIDYEASRTLYLSNKLLPATVLANTAIEKYLKGYFIFYDIDYDKVHSIPKLLEKLKIVDGDFQKDYKIKSEYAHVLDDIYTTRYLESKLNRTNCYFISKNKHLAELDELVNWLEHKLSIEDTSYKQNVAKNNIDIWDKNFILNQKVKKEYIESLDTVYGIGIHNRKIIEASVQNNYQNTKDDMRFDYPNIFTFNKVGENKFNITANF